MPLLSQHDLQSHQLPRPGASKQGSVTPLRIGVVGARCRHQGVGGHVARYLAGLGADVVAVCGTTQETVSQACQDLHQSLGLLPRGYIGIEAMLRQEPLDAVAICSPERFHRQHLAAVLSCGADVLCEKPLLFEPDRDPVADAAVLAAGFASAGRVLMVSEQWPYTLGAYASVHPDVELSAPPKKLSMWLSPSVAGSSMIPNAVPHLLSMLWHLCPAGGTLAQLRLDCHDETSMAIRFDYEHCRGVTEVKLALRQAIRQPRAAGYALDGRGVRRVVEMTAYRQFFEPCGEDFFSETGTAARQRQPIKDPLQLLLAEFLARIERRRASSLVWQDATLLERLAALRAIATAAEQMFPQM